ncbi:MAG: 16S rRNA (cytidine(1402)-2'-O)-methyltransferase [Rhodobacteraceae bacterium]|nr:16S rRNA (cytidine(1402)-2'-O)-methyltransferase [Paracoccaceae bacterium]
MSGQPQGRCAKTKENHRASKRPAANRNELLTDRPQSLDSALYFVATPIGTARDITLRALDILATADILAAEDTRNTRRLMDIHGIALNGRPLIAYHDHNGPAQRPRLIRALHEGKSVAYVSDAGTPLIADPGFALAREAIAKGLEVRTAPGASALLAALSVAGLPTDQFFFAGFLPTKSNARRNALATLLDVPGTLVFFESGKRIGKSLGNMCEVFGGDRQAAVCRELTKRFEEVRRGTLGDLAAEYDGASPKGEIVVLVGPAPERAADPGALDQALTAALQGEASLRDAVDQVAAALGLPRKAVYARALEMGRDTEKGKER